MSLQGRWNLVGAKGAISSPNFWLQILASNFGSQFRPPIINLSAEVAYKTNLQILAIISFITWNLHFFCDLCKYMKMQITLIKLDAKVNKNDVQIQPARFIDWCSTAAW